MVKSGTMQPVRSPLTCNMYRVAISNILVRYIHQLLGLDCILQAYRAAYQVSIQLYTKMAARMVFT